MTLNWHVLDIDARAEVERLSGELREATATVLHKKRGGGSHFRRGR